ncbi:MAG: cupredoxin domain-containing protein [Acidimicrobiales bacterium]
MSRSPRLRATHLAAVAGLVALVPLAACTDNDTDDTGSGGTRLTVSSTDDACTVTPTEVPAGDVVFEVTNDGSEATEFYLYAADGTEIVAEVENIGPGLTRDMSAEVSAGTYVTACKPGMTGDGIRGDLTVTGG